MKEVFSFGYGSHQPAELLAFAEKKDAIVIDTRYAPFSRQAQWRKAALEKSLGSRYRSVRELGNVNYKGGEIKIHDMERGLLIVKPILTVRPIILMCVCWNATTCHRTMVARRMEREWGVEIVPVYENDLKLPPAPPLQQSLF